MKVPPCNLIDKLKNVRFTGSTIGAACALTNTPKFTIEERMLMPRQSPSGYETKFAEFIRMCDESKANGITDIVIATHHAIGDTLEETVESIVRLDAAGLKLHIATPRN